MKWTLTSPILCVALNPSIDKRLHVDRLRPGEVQRAIRHESTAGGKGLNAARVAAALGAEVRVTGFIGGSNGDWIRNRLKNAGIDQEWIAVAGESRSCLNLIDDRDGTSTEILEPGPLISSCEAAAFRKLWGDLAVPGRWIALSGSLPRGLGEVYYADLIAAAKSRGAYVVFDASGAALAHGMASGPHTVKPNEEEFRHWTGSDPRDTPAIRGLAEELGRQGVRALIVSLGREGCIAASPGGALWRSIPPSVQAVNAVGSGDSFVAGWTVASASGLALPDALRLATAVGAANALTETTGGVDRRIVEELLEQVIVERV